VYAWPVLGLGRKQLCCASKGQPRLACKQNGFCGIPGATEGTGNNRGGWRSEGVGKSLVVFDEHQIVGSCRLNTRDARYSDVPIPYDFTPCEARYVRQ
jgi:hypothetical protein